MIRSIALAALFLVAPTPCQDEPAPIVRRVEERATRSTRVEFEGEVLQAESTFRAVDYEVVVRRPAADRRTLAFRRATVDVGEGPRDLGLAGRTVVARRTAAGRWTFEIEDDDLADGALDFLEGEIGRERFPFAPPPAGTGPGETFEVPLAPVLDYLGVEFDDFEGTPMRLEGRGQPPAEVAGQPVARYGLLLDVRPETMGQVQLLTGEVLLEGSVEVPADGVGPWRRFDGRLRVEAIGGPERGTDDVLTEFLLTVERRESFRPLDE